MASVVLGLGTSHTPQLSSPPDLWRDHGSRDERNQGLVGKDYKVHTYEELVSMAPAGIAEQLNEACWSDKYRRAQRGLAALEEALLLSNPDIVVVIGNDQDEVFLDDCIPVFAIFAGEALLDLPVPLEKLEAMPPSLRDTIWTMHGDAPETYAGVPALAEHLVQSLVEDDFDVCQVRRQASGRPLSHAFTFVRRRIMGKRYWPTIAVAVNAQAQLNQPSSARCLEFGRAMRRAIESWQFSKRVTVVASGGLSHFVVNEELDRVVLDSIVTGDLGALSRLRRDAFQSGTGEILNWITAAGVLEGLQATIVDYIPGYRSEAGTGVGMCFAIWK